MECADHAAAPAGGRALKASELAADDSTAQEQGAVGLLALFPFNNDLVNSDADQSMQTFL